jgi:hypothetical protein
MSEKSEWAEPVVRAHHHQPQPRKRRPKRGHLAVALGIAPTVKVDEHGAIRIGSNLCRPDIQVETVFVSLDVLKPSCRKLWARRSEVDGLSDSTPFRRRQRRFPPKLADWRRCKRNTEKLIGSRVQTEMSAFKQTALQPHSWLLLFLLCRTNVAELQAN